MYDIFFENPNKKCFFKKIQYYLYKQVKVSLLQIFIIFIILIIKKNAAKIRIKIRINIQKNEKYPDNSIFLSNFARFF